MASGDNRLGADCSARATRATDRSGTAACPKSASRPSCSAGVPAGDGTRASTGATIAREMRALQKIDLRQPTPHVTLSEGTRRLTPHVTLSERVRRVSRRVSTGLEGPRRIHRHPELREILRLATLAQNDRYRGTTELTSRPLWVRASRPHIRPSAECLAPPSRRGPDSPAGKPPPSPCQPRLQFKIENSKFKINNTRQATTTEHNRLPLPEKEAQE